jgi:hypothetical protein
MSFSNPSSYYLEALEIVMHNRALSPVFDQSSNALYALLYSFFKEQVFEAKYI